MMRIHTILLAVIAVMTLSGCSTVEDIFGEEQNKPLEGERISILELQQNLEPESDTLDAQGFVAPDAWRNEFWPQTGGYPNHSMQNLQLNNGRLNLAWKESIGEGSTKELPLTAQPIVVDSRIFALDTRSRLTAYDITTGDRLWKTNVGDKNEDDPVIGGGVAYSRGRLFVTTGYDELLAVNPGNGEIIWRQDLPAPARAAPTIMDERVFVTTLDNRLIAISGDTGNELWEFTGIAEATGLVGAASPAASRDVVIPAFSSGEIFALRLENGTVVWGENLSSFRRIGGVAGLSDIRGLPVIDKGVVIAISFAGRMVAIDERTGGRIWQREIGGSETPWVAGNHIFVITSDSELVALGRDTGIIRWVSQLPKWKDVEDKKGAIYWTGPVLAGGRLIAASSEGDVAEIRPDDGSMINMWDSGKTIRIPPIVAGETLYLLAEDGTLMAYR